MIINLLPLFLVGVQGVRINIIGLIEEGDETTASLLKIVLSALSDRLAVLGFAFPKDIP